MRLPEVELSLSRDNLELFDTRVTEIMSGDLWEVKGRPLTLPDDKQVDIAIKSCTPAPHDRLVLIGLARYKNGRVIGEAHTQPIYNSPSWREGHTHARALCTTFERRGNMFPKPEVSARNISRLRDERALGTGCVIMRWMATVGGPVNDFFHHAKAKQMVRRLQTNAREPLFFNPALRYAVDLDNPEVG